MISGTTANVEDAQTVTVTFSDGTTTISKTASVSSDAFALTVGQLADITNLNDGPITVTASVSDAHGNAATTASRTITLDNLAPQVSIDATLEVDNIVNNAEEASVVVTGTSAGAAGRTVTVTATDSNGDTDSGTATIETDGTYSVTLDVNALADGNLTITADVSDLAGNAAAQASKTITLDDTAPTVTIDGTLEGDNKVNASEDGDVVVSGSSSGLAAGSTVSVTLADSSSTVSTTATVLSSGAWVAEPADISALTDGNITVTADASDTAGNAASAATKTITLDNAAPSAPTITSISTPNSDTTPTISGTAEARLHRHYLCEWGAFGDGDGYWRQLQLHRSEFRCSPGRQLPDYGDGN